MDKKSIIKTITKATIILGAAFSIFYIVRKSKNVKESKKHST